MSTAVPVDYEGLFKVCVLFENVKLSEFSFYFVYFFFVLNTLKLTMS